MRRNVFITFLGLILLTSPRGVWAETLVTKEGLAEDVQILRGAMVHLHPGLYRFNTPEEMESAFRALEQDCDRPRTLRYTFLALSRFTAKIRSYSTRVRLESQTEDIGQELWGGSNKLPFLVRWESGRMIVSSAPEEFFKPGDEIEMINGVFVGDLARRLFSHVTSDGSNDANRWAQLEVTGLRRYELFDLLQPLLVPPDGGVYHVRPAGDDAPVYDLSAVSRRPARPPGDQWEYQVLDGRLAHLRMGTFDFSRSSFDWKGFLADTFDDIKARGLRHVALDIRGNAGGSTEVLVELAKYVVWQPAVMPGVQRLVRYETVPPDVRPYLSASDRGFFDLSGKVTEAPGGMFLYRDAEREALEPTPNALIAKYYLLVDGHNAAAAFTLAQFLQENKLATLIGGTTGGNQRGINGGQFFFLKLPNSGIVVDIPLIASVPLDAKPDAGLTPDVRISPEGALDTARRLAARN